MISTTLAILFSVRKFWKKLYVSWKIQHDKVQKRHQRSTKTLTTKHHKSLVQLARYCFYFTGSPMEITGLRWVLLGGHAFCWTLGMVSKTVFLWHVCLIHWAKDKMTATLQMTFLIFIFSDWKLSYFDVNFYEIYFKSPVNNNHHWLR